MGKTQSILQLAEGDYVITALVKDDEDNQSTDTINIEVNVIDADGDGSPLAGEGVPANEVDCNDNDPSISPNAEEIIGDGIDQDCDALEKCHVDSDMDTYGDPLLTITSSNLLCNDTQNNESTNTLDCDDGNSAINPGATEIIGDGIDQDCDAQELCYVDSDMDMFGNDLAMTVVSFDLICDYTDSESDNTLDCDDTNNLVNPNAEEIFGNGLDDNCSGEEDEGFTDGDRDGFLPPIDCNDADNTVYPGAEELEDGKDNDCNGSVDDGLDIDQDGYVTGSDEDPTTDCNDDDPAINPGAIEVYDEIDNNCDDEIDNVIEKIVSPVFQADLTDKQNHSYDKLADKWQKEIEKLEKENIKLEEKVVKYENKGKTDKAQDARDKISNNEIEIAILEDKIAVVRVSLGDIPEEHVIVDTYEEMSSKQYKETEKEIKKWEKKIKSLNSSAEKSEKKALKYENDGKQNKADKARAKIPSIQAEIALIENLIQVLECAIDFEAPVDNHKPHHDDDDDDHKPHHDDDDD